MRCTLEIELFSDAAFSLGGGVSGLVDAEIQHDRNGLPVISGRSLKGLLVNECANLLYVLPGEKEKWKQAALRLFGARGELQDQAGALWIGDATMPPDLVCAIQRQVHTDKLAATDVLDSLTAIRVQTAMNFSGAPRDESLRAIRVMVRGITLYAPVHLDDQADEIDRALLAACVMSLRRAGLGRTRGKGKITARLTNRPLEAGAFAKSETPTPDTLTETWYQPFQQAIKEVQA